MTREVVAKFAGEIQIDGQNCEMSSTTRSFLAGVADNQLEDGMLSEISLSNKHLSVHSSQNDTLTPKPAEILALPDTRYC